MLDSATPKIGSCLVGQFWGLNLIPPATGPPKSRALPEWVTTRVLSLDAVEQAYQEAVQGVNTQRCQNSQACETFGSPFRRTRHSSQSLQNNRDK